MVKSCTKTAKKTSAKTMAKAGERHARDMAERQRQQTLAKQMVGKQPQVRDYRRRKRARTDFGFFCRTYFPAAFYLPWSPDHLKVIARIEQVILKGRLFALAMPRGSGKSTLTFTATIWAILYGHRGFVVIIAATDDRAREILSGIKTALRFNEMLYWDFPKEIHAIRALEGEARRSGGQRDYKGSPTSPEWSANRVVFPTWPGSKASGARITATGLTGSGIRGQYFVLSDGETVVRPDLALIDDPQDRESAKSETQVKDRVKLLNGDVLQMGGPDRQISALLPVTVIYRNDVAYKMLDRSLSPSWQGEKMVALTAMPTRMDLWEDYDKLRCAELEAGKEPDGARKMYVGQRDEMSAGAVISWPERFPDTKVDALHNLMDLYLEFPDVFAAEFQNDPLDDTLGDAYLTAVEAAQKVNGMARGLAPAETAWITSFVDVHDRVLFYVVVAWTPTFTGYVLDYGTYPDQDRPDFTVRNAKPTLADKHPQAGPDGQKLEGIKFMTSKLLERHWARDDDTSAQIALCPVDAGYVRPIVHAAITATQQTARLAPSAGRGIGAKNLPFREFSYKRGDRKGFYWGIFSRSREPLRTIEYDANYWKSRVHLGFATALGDPASISLWGHQREHTFFGAQICSEYPTRVEANGRAVDEWMLRPGGENHWLDCMVGAAVAASVLGARIPGTRGPKAPPRVKLSELQRTRRGR